MIAVTANDTTLRNGRKTRLTRQTIRRISDTLRLPEGLYVGFPLGGGEGSCGPSYPTRPAQRFGVFVDLLYTPWGLHSEKVTVRPPYSFL